jgi:hypothetical protein
MERSREALIVRQDTHIDALIDKLSEERLGNIVDAIISGNVDLLISFGGKRFVIEIKIYRDSKTEPKGLLQTVEYLRTSGVTDGYLVIFDRRAGRTWEEKIYQKVETVGNETVQIWGM